MFVPNSPRFQIRWLVRPSTAAQPWLSDEQWVPGGERAIYTYARTGIYAALTSHTPEGAGMNGSNGRDKPLVLVPSYIPHGVVWAILRAGYQVRYYPVNDDLTLPKCQVESRIRELKPAAVIFVHYLGFADPNFDSLVEKARDVGALIVEDCARALFSRDRDGTLLGSTGDIAVYSLHKLLPVPNGGLAITRGRTLPQPTESCSERSDILVSMAMSMARALGIPPRWSREEPETTPSIETHRPPDDVWPDRGPGWLSRKGLATVKPGRVASIRRARYRKLRTNLEGYGEFRVITPPAHPGAVPYGVGVVFSTGIDRRQQLYAALCNRGLPAEIFSWPIFHGRATPFQDPGARTLRTSMLVIPTHQQVSKQAINRICVTIDDAMEGEFSQKPLNRAAPN